MDEDLAPRVRNTREHGELARRIARESLVPLTNEGGVVPLAGSVSSITVIGPNADTIQLGNYSGYVDRGKRSRDPGSLVPWGGGRQRNAAYREAN